MKILHLENSEDDAELICAALSHDGDSCDTLRVETREAFRQALDSDGWDVILADYTLPVYDGLSALKLAVEKRPWVPFIFVTGSLGEDRAVEVLKNGATDYIPKHRLDRLALAVARARRESESAQAQRDAERQIKESLREKVLLLQEVHHRVKNNLQIISGLLNMQSAAVGDARLTSVFDECQRRVISMSLIHEMLYDSSSLAHIDFAEYVHKLASELSDSYGIDPERIRLRFELEPVRLDIGQAIPCGLVLNELLSNVFKHAFPDWRSGEVLISMRKNERSVRLAIGDTGVGLPVNRLPDDGRTGLGMTIVEILTRQLKGNMEITSNNGSQFVLTFEESVA
jgi:two-component sensor histidine kinase